MAKVKKHDQTNEPKLRPALSPEAEENQLIALATDEAAKRLRNGTASNQLIIHYLKLGNPKERIERAILEKQKELIEAKTESLRSEKRREELFTEAINAMRRYSGNGETDEGY
jgi:uncharacterized protein YcaQ